MPLFAEGPPHAAIWALSGSPDLRAARGTSRPAQKLPREDTCLYSGGRGCKVVHGTGKLVAWPLASDISTFCAGRGGRSARGTQRRAWKPRGAGIWKS